MARITFALLAFCVSISAFAHEPCRECEPVRQRIDVIGPIGNDFRQSYRRTCNRPRYLSGKIAYLIAPSSQEAMAWHKAEHKCAYEKDLGRIEPHYFYPKPWEALRIGPRATLASKRSSLKPVKQNEAIELVPSAPNDAMELSDDNSDATRPDLATGDEKGNGSADEADVSDDSMKLPAPKTTAVEPAIKPETLPLGAPSTDTIQDLDAPLAPKPLLRMKKAIQDSTGGPVGSGLK